MRGERRKRPPIIFAEGPQRAHAAFLSICNLNITLFYLPTNPSLLPREINKRGQLPLFRQPGAWFVIPKTERRLLITFCNFNIWPALRASSRRWFDLPNVRGRAHDLTLGRQVFPCASGRPAASLSSGERRELTNMVSLCFWYAHARAGRTTHTSVVVLPRKQMEYAVFSEKWDSLPIF